MDRDFIERKIPITLDLWLREHDGQEVMVNEHRAAVDSLTEFIVSDLANNWEQIQLAKAHKRMSGIYYNAPE